MALLSTNLLHMYTNSNDLLSDKHPNTIDVIEEMQAFLSFTVVAADGNLANDRRVIANKGTLLTLTLPATAQVGTAIEIVGLGAGGWKVAQNANQLIHRNGAASTTGTGGHIDSANRYDCVRLVCIVANTEWAVASSQGAITLT